MRYVLSAVLIVIGLVAGLLGVAQMTVWAPSDTQTASVQLDDPGPVLVIEPGVLNLYGTPATLEASAADPEADITVSRTTKENADSWVGESDVTRVTGLADEETLAVTASKAGEGAAEAPAEDEAPADGDAATEDATDDATEDAAADEAAEGAGSDEGEGTSEEDAADEPAAEEALTEEDIAALATVPAPGRADLWEETTSDTGTVSLVFDEDAGRTAFVIGTDGESPAAASVQITWPASTETPWAIPLIAAGGVFVLGGAVILFFGIRKTRSDAARRRARQERRRKLAETGAAFAVIPVIALAGCSPAELPTPQPDAAPSEPAGAVSDDQLAEVLSRIASTVTDADEDLDADALGDRASGPFLEQREDAYAVKEDAEDQSLPPAVAVDEVLVNFTAATDQWPRITSAVTRDEESGQVQLLVLSQQDPRADYTLWAQTELQPGTELPEIADAREGSELIDPEAEGLRLAPNAVAGAYADFLDNDEDSDHAGTFAEDAFAEQTVENRQVQTSALEDGGAEIEFAYSGDENQVTAMRTADGGAIVTGVVTTRSTITPDSTESTTGTLTLPSPASEITGSSTTSSPLEQTTRMVLTWVVPEGEDDEIVLVGVNEVYTGAELG